MDLLTLLTLAVGLAMDAFAVSICKGLAMREKVLKKGIIVGLWFGGFQALMPTIGFFLGTQFKDQITSIDHWIAFVLLGLIGINMVKEALSNDEEQADDSIAVKEMFMLAVATSINALAVGITFAFLNVHIVSAASMIGVCTFLISFAGVKIGNIFGTKYKSKAELAGGIILILLGFKRFCLSIFIFSKMKISFFFYEKECNIIKAMAQDIVLISRTTTRFCARKWKHTESCNFI